MRPREDAAKLEERRRMAVRMVTKEGKTQAEVAQQLRVTPAAVSTWMRWQRGKATRGLSARRSSGRPCLLKVAQAKALCKKMLKGAQSCGYANDLWTCPRIQNLIRREFGVSYHLNHVPKLLRSLGFSPQRPMHRAVERDEPAIQRWVSREWPRIKKKPKNSRQP